MPHENTVSNYAYKIKPEEWIENILKEILTLLMNSNI